MVIVNSQSKLFQYAGLWTWRKSYKSASPVFLNYVEAMISQLVQ